MWLLGCEWICNKDSCQIIAPQGSHYTVLLHRLHRDPCVLDEALDEIRKVCNKATFSFAYSLPSQSLPPPPVPLSPPSLPPSLLPPTLPPTLPPSLSLPSLPSLSQLYCGDLCHVLELCLRRSVEQRPSSKYTQSYILGNVPPSYHIIQ